VVLKQFFDFIAVSALLLFEPADVGMWREPNDTGYVALIKLLLDFVAVGALLLSEPADVGCGASPTTRATWRSSSSSTSAHRYTKARGGMRFARLSMIRGADLCWKISRQARQKRPTTY